ncbi:acid phosphatase type 7 isoform X1 [Papilio machaon]|uniref:acid phosphatase type 7 isoform X1 n=1 Tax=Papilio machaon TaxID=76193 RepID=UPI001E665456|nr:acid phosphatase type 7 isoform X1 [Papilio machaon]
MITFDIGNMKILILFLCVAFSRAKIEQQRVGPGYDCPYCQPEQVHISFGEKTNDIVATWSTFNDTGESRAQYGVGQMDQEASGRSTLFVDGGHERRAQFIHRVLMKDLKHDTTYVYHVGSEFGWSEEFWFKTPPAGEDWVVRAAIFGDMGNKNAHALSYLQDEAQRGHFDLIIHVGDFAYDMHDDNARVGDQFMRQVQPLAALVPYMTCPGNHEEAYNFSNYRARFSMPGGAESLYYSYDVGPVHFVSISTEPYYFLQYGLKVLENQFRWLHRDLSEANREENRAKRPWIVLYGHRPMYCSNSDDIDCSFEYTRKGLPIWGSYGMEPLLKQYGVDLVVWAHEHSYERLWPVYDEQVYNGSLHQPYTNPGAPVHIVTGSAGCQERIDPFVSKPPSWSAFRSTDYGYTRFFAHNKTHIHIEQVDADLKGEVIDSFWLIKHRHHPFYNL